MRKRKTKSSTHRGGCHAGNVEVIRMKGHSIYGAGYTRGIDTEGNIVVVDLADIITVSSVKSYGIELPEELISASKTTKTIKINWDDGSIPALNRAFWFHFASFLQHLNDDIVVCCLGGHGRTGTALAILSALIKNLKTDPVAWVRKHYCTNAVETYRQIKYIEAITGLTVNAEPILPRFGGYYAYSEFCKK